ncbi:unnamed protein product [Bursaphelenchus xylophilus]|uniref:(pine wood nematode) hypothetical protein n=1 Tax=Bursaphelenchus xylophilus TaxID=6326 RepID=A0A1I7S482_BURXY|nr:unnamed protein product [Bursaphelenchus xylophilus]CAG9116822.1 unnamed protein product [Bursaphelenchus xylophilus]
MQPALVICLVASVVGTAHAFYALPPSFQRYMSDRSMLRPSAPLPQLVPFLPPVPIALEEEPIAAEPHPNNAKGYEEVQVPRRSLRQFIGETHQMKRMRPCFYSPIQCLMKKRSQP